MTVWRLAFMEEMIDRYLDRGTMFVLEDDGVKCECGVTDECGVQLVDMVYLRKKYKGVRFFRGKDMFPGTS